MISLLLELPGRAFLQLLVLPRAGQAFTVSSKPSCRDGKTSHGSGALLLFVVMIQRN